MTPRVIASRSSATFLPVNSIRDEAACDAAAAVPAAASPVLRAVASTCCWRPRALPPAFAARLREAALWPEDDEEELRLRLLLLLAALLPLLALLLDELDLRADEPLDFARDEPLLAVDFFAVEARLLEPPLDFFAPELLPRVLLPRELLLLELERPEPELELRDVEPPELRDVEPPELRELDPLEDLRDDDLLREPPLPDDFPPLLPPLDSAIALPPLKLCPLPAGRAHYLMPTMDVTCA